MGWLWDGYSGHGLARQRNELLNPASPCAAATCQSCGRSCTRTAASRVLQLDNSIGICLQASELIIDGPIRGEGGIRTLPCPIASTTCRFYIATDAKLTTFAAHPCTLLHAGKIR
jgi:hypothetical protein